MWVMSCLFLVDYVCSWFFLVVICGYGSSAHKYNWGDEHRTSSSILVIFGDVHLGCRVSTRSHMWYVTYVHLRPDSACIPRIVKIAALGDVSRYPQPEATVRANVRRNSGSLSKQEHNCMTKRRERWERQEQRLATLGFLHFDVLFFAHIFKVHACWHTHTHTRMYILYIYPHVVKDIQYVYVHLNMCADMEMCRFWQDWRSEITFRSNVQLLPRLDAVRWYLANDGCVGVYRVNLFWDETDVAPV